jgi:HlyD family secretion protein
LFGYGTVIPTIEREICNFPTRNGWHGGCYYGRRRINSLDIPRKAPNRKLRRILIAGAGIILLAAITLGLSQLKPAAPSVEKNTVWVDKVKRGLMLRQVRGTGTLVPELVLFIPAATEGRVERILILPGSVVTADSVLLELSNSELELASRDAELQLRAAIAEFENIRARLQSEKMDQEAIAAQVKSDYLAARLRAEADESLAKEGLVPDITLKISKGKAEELALRYEIEKKRLGVSEGAVKAQINVQQTKVDQMKALYQLRKDQVVALRVRAGTDGVLQQLPVQVGQRVTLGTTLAKVAQPEKLKAELKIAETQAKDILIGQVASVDTRNGVIPGHVIRIDPAVQNGTVTVDVALDGPLPKGARPDLTVDGTVELERLESVLYVGRPASGQEESAITLFKIDRDGTTAHRVKVKLGRSSVNTIEIIEGLSEGDSVILSDMSQWDEFDRIKLS